jgi:hypothetical protein
MAPAIALSLPLTLAVPGVPAAHAAFLAMIQPPWSRLMITVDRHSRPLHKRTIFYDELPSRPAPAAGLRGHPPDPYVTHPAEQRHRARRASPPGRSCIAPRLHPGELGGGGP